MLLHGGAAGVKDATAASALCDHAAPVIDLAHALSRCGLFRGFDAPRLRALAAAAREIAVPAGDVLFHEGDPSDAMYVVLEGAMQIYTRDVSGI
jgi:Cyclic nucleotide-binding domain